MSSFHSLLVRSTNPTQPAVPATNSHLMVGIDYPPLSLCTDDASGAPPQILTSSSQLPYNDSQKQQVISAANGLISVFKSLSDAAAKA